MNIKGRLSPAAINYMKAFGSYSFAHFSGLYNEIRRQKLWQVLDLFVAARHRDTLCWGMMFLFENTKHLDAWSGQWSPLSGLGVIQCLAFLSGLHFSFHFFFSFSFQTHDHKKTFSTCSFDSLWNIVLGAEKEEHTHIKMIVGNQSNYTHTHIYILCKQYPIGWKSGQLIVYILNILECPLNAELTLHCSACICLLSLLLFWCSK